MLSVVTQIKEMSGHRAFFQVVGHYDRVSTPREMGDFVKTKCKRAENLAVMRGYVNCVGLCFPFCWKMSDKSNRISGKSNK